MITLSENTLPKDSFPNELKAPAKTTLPKWHWSFRRLMLVLLTVAFLFLFLPWTQTIQADGRVTTLLPEQRPQTVHATIAGRIEHWYVKEGQAVKRGDTLVYLSEVKADYFDPSLVDRVSRQLDAKKGAMGSYGQKAQALESQAEAIHLERNSKSSQIETKIAQAQLKLQSDSLKVLQARVDQQVAKRQWTAMQNLYDKGLEPLTKLEERRLKAQDADTKLATAENQWASSRNELAIYSAELQLVKNEAANKIAKAQSDFYSTLSDRFDAEATVSKLEIERENYSRRQAYYYILAPQDGFIVKAIKPGIGEIIKEGEPLLSIQPAGFAPAVEMFVKPVDIPLLSLDSKVRFAFDGWPSFFFSGWPGLSTGTFGGKVAAIDRNISANGKFRVLVAPDPDEPSWPDAILPGGGAKGIALLGNVPLWYEFWRILNGFPPDFYKQLPAGQGKEERK